MVPKSMLLIQNIRVQMKSRTSQHKIGEMDPALKTALTVGAHKRKQHSRQLIKLRMLLQEEDPLQTKPKLPLIVLYTVLGREPKRLMNTTVTVESVKEPSMEPNMNLEIKEYK